MVLFLDFRDVIKIVMLNKAFNVRVEDLLQLEDFVIGYSQVFLIVYAGYVLDDLNHLGVVLLAKEGHYRYAVL